MALCLFQGPGNLIVRTVGFGSVAAWRSMFQIYLEKDIAKDVDIRILTVVSISSL